MSWNVKIIGKKANVVRQVTTQLITNGNVPDVGRAIIDEINAMQDPTPANGYSGYNAVMVSGWGHHGGGIGALMVEGAILAEDAPAESTAAAADTSGTVPASGPV